MAVKGRQNTVTSGAAVQLGVSPDGRDGQSGSSFSILATDQSFYLGGSDVTSSNGALITSAMLPLAFDLAGGELVYAIAASSTATVTTLQTGA
jgi:hypothetical protein